MLRPQPLSASSFEIEGHYAGRTVAFAWRDGQLSCSDPAVLAALRFRVSIEGEYRPLPHIHLQPDLADRAFAQTFLAGRFLASVDRLAESPPLELPGDVA